MGDTPNSTTGDASTLGSIGVRAGDVLADKYRIDKILGAGGMGVVVAAHHVKLDERVAIKFLLPEALANAETMARFHREARAAVKIKSEHVARVLDVGVLETGAPYLVMEYLEGGDLSAWLRERGRLEVEQAVDFILQACEAIAEAHAIGIIHRDLKPANLFCIRRPDGRFSVKVLDFGISKVANMGISGPEASVTRTTAVMGSPLYMSPEQMQSSRDVDPRSDIWAMGIILYELLAGQVPFSGETFPEVCINIATRPAPPLRSFRPDAPPGLEAVIARCLEKDRARRYANIAELAVALLPFGSPRARGSVETITQVIQAAGMATGPFVLQSIRPAGSTAQGPTGASWAQTAAPTTQNTKTAAIAAGAAAFVVLAIGAGVALKMLSRPAPASPTAALSSEPAPAAHPLPAQEPTPPANSAPAIAPAAVAVAPAEPAPSSSGAVTAPMAGAKKRPVASPATPAKIKPAVDCDPPYYFDAKGTRIFKKDCL